MQQRSKAVAKRTSTSPSMPELQYALSGLPCFNRCSNQTKGHLQVPKAVSLSFRCREAFFGRSTSAEEAETLMQTDTPPVSPVQVEERGTQTEESDKLPTPTHGDLAWRDSTTCA